jgi:hypothetical protein
MLSFLGTFSVNFEIPDYWGDCRVGIKGLWDSEKTVTVNSVGVGN